MTKHLLTLSMLCVLASVATAQTVFTGTTTLLSGGTNNVAANATNSPSSLRIDVPRASEFALYVSARPYLNSTNFVNLYLVMYPSIDGTTIANTDAVVYNLAGTTNSSGLVVGVESITAGAVPYYFITSVGNAAAHSIAATNVTVSYGAKIAR